MNWTDEIKNNFKGLLAQTVVTVTFVKNNGDFREMRATLDPSFFPNYEFSSTRPENKDVCTVWDTDINEWRAFRYDSIKSFSLTLE